MKGVCKMGREYRVREREPRELQARGRQSRELDDVKKIFGRRLKTLREEKDLMQQELADALGVKRTSISNYETGRQFPDITTIKKIADFFETTIEDLIEETDEAADKTIESHNELIIDLENGLSIEEIAAKQRIFVDGVELPLEHKKAILEQIEFQYRKWQKSI